MGDARYERSYDALRRSRDQGAAVHALSDEQIVEALTAAALRQDGFLANVLATEAMNRMRRLRAALANLGEGVVALGLDGSIHWMNPAAEHILKVSWQEAAKEPFDRFVDHLDEDRRPVQESFVARAGRGESVSRDGEWFLVGGRGEICVSYTASPIHGSDGSIHGVVLSFQDCSDRKRAERDLRESRERYKTLFDRIDVGIISVSVDGRVLDVNAAAERITKRPFAEAEGRPWAEFLHPEDLYRVMDVFQSMLRGQEASATLRLLHSDGHYVKVDALGIPIVVDGNVVGFHGVLHAK